MLLKKLKKVEQRIKTVQDMQHFHLDSQQQEIALQAKKQLQACSHQLQYQENPHPNRKMNLNTNVNMSSRQNRINDMWEGNLNVSDKTCSTQRQKYKTRSVYLNNNRNNNKYRNQGSKTNKKQYAVYQEQEQECQRRQNWMNVTCNSGWRLHSPRKASHNVHSRTHTQYNSNNMSNQQLYFSRNLTKTQLNYHSKNGTRNGYNNQIDRQTRIEKLYTFRSCCKNPDKYYRKDKSQYRETFPDKERPKTSKKQKQLIIRLNSLQHKFTPRNTYSFNDTMIGNRFSLIETINSSLNQSNANDNQNHGQNQNSLQYQKPKTSRQFKINLRPEFLNLIEKIKLKEQARFINKNKKKIKVVNMHKNAN